jgi:hypothetical protein
MFQFTVGRRSNERFPGNRTGGADAALKKWLAMNLNTVRLPVPTPHQLDAADELGVLVVAESMVDGVLVRIDPNDSSFWAVAREQVTDWVMRDRSHPSIVIWSVENEVMLGHGGNRGFVAPLRGLGDHVRALDSSRPLMFEGDGDLEGYADIINLHYPHKTVESACTGRLHPDALPAKLDQFPGTLREWNKPLYLGEFGWSFQRGFYTPAEYMDFIREYRLAGVAGIAPFVMPAGAARAFAPVAAYVDACAPQSARGSTTIHVFNDSADAASVTAEWEIGADGRTLRTGRESLSIRAGEHRASAVERELPADAAAAHARIRLMRGGEVVFEDRRELRGSQRTGTRPDTSRAPEQPAKPPTADQSKPASAEQFGSNQLKNASFEDGDSTPDGWYTWTQNSSGTPRYQRDANEHTTGRYSVSISDESGSWAQDIPHDSRAGTRYLLRARVKTRDVRGTAKIAVLWLRKDQSLVRLDVSSTLSGTRAWQDVRLEKDVPSGAAIARIFLITDMTAGTVWYDDAQFQYATRR